MIVTSLDSILGIYEKCYTEQKSVFLNKCSGLNHFQWVFNCLTAFYHSFWIVSYSQLFDPKFWTKMVYCCYNRKVGSKKVVNLSEAAMSTVIGNYDTNKQWAVVGVVLYNKNYVQTNEVTDFCIMYLVSSCMSIKKFVTYSSFINQKKKSYILHKLIITNSDFRNLFLNDVK